MVDLHAGGVTWEFEPTAGFYRDEDMSLAMCFGFTLWQMPETVGVLSREFRHARGAAIGVELGYGGVRDEALVADAERAIIAVVLGHTPDAAGPVYRHYDVLAAASGEWTGACTLGQTVVAGEKLGVIHNWTGTPVHEVCSPQAGRVLAVRRLVSVGLGDMVAVIGLEPLGLER